MLVSLDEKIVTITERLSFIIGLIFLSFQSTRLSHRICVRDNQRLLSCSIGILLYDELEIKAAAEMVVALMTIQ